MGDQRVFGLGSGGFFVAPEARTLGFYLFKRYLNSAGWVFFFATTCNANSSVLWRAVGASALANFEAEYILPLKLDVLLPAFLASRTVSVVAGEFARAVGRYANPALGLLRRKPSTLVVEPCRDWEKLAALFHRHRPAEWTTTDRSPAFLRWRYGQNAANRRFEIFVFRDTLGNEGWFALGTITRGRGGVIRGRIVLDLVWPREKLGFGETCPAILRVGEAGADAIYFKPRRDLDYRECGRWLVRRRSPVPAGFAIPRKGCTAISVSSLDLLEADGDGAF